MKILNSAKSGESLFIEPSFVWHKATTMKRNEGLGRLCYDNLPTTKANLTFKFSYRYLCRSTFAFIKFQETKHPPRITLLYQIQVPTRLFYSVTPPARLFPFASLPLFPSGPPIRLFPSLLIVR